MIRTRFRLDIGRITRNIEAKVLLVQQKVAFQILDGIVNMTPVDTGRARGNWQVTIGRAAEGHDWEKKDKAGGGTIEAGRATISSLSTLGAIYITNNLPYIGALERGHSKQAPSGMVRVTLDRVSTQFR